MRKRKESKKNCIQKLKFSSYRVVEDQRISANFQTFSNFTLKLNFFLLRDLQPLEFYRGNIYFKSDLLQLETLINIKS